MQPNQLVLTVQPNEGVSLSLGAKIPGTRLRIRPVNMEFLYGTSFLSQSPEAYERLIMDAMRGDPTLFTRNDEVEEQWRIIDPILEGVGDRRHPARRVRGGLPRARGGGQHPQVRTPLAGHLDAGTASEVPDAAASGRREDTAPGTSRRRCATCSSNSTRATGRTRPHGCSTWSWSWTASGAARS